MTSPSVIVLSFQPHQSCDLSQITLLSHLIVAYYHDNPTISYIAYYHDNPTISYIAHVQILS